MRYDLQTSLKGKAESRDLDDMKQTYASMEFVGKIKNRLDKIQETLISKGKIRADSSGSDEDSRASRSHSRGSLSELEEESNEDGQSDRPSSRKDKKNSSIKKNNTTDKNKAGDLMLIEEEKDGSIQSEKEGAGGQDENLGKSQSKRTLNDSEQRQSTTNNNQGGGGSGGPSAAVSAETELRIRSDFNQKMDQMKETMEEQSETISNLQKEINDLRTDMLTQLSTSIVGGGNKKEKKSDESKKAEVSSGAVDAINAKVKEIETRVKNIDVKYEKRIIELDQNIKIQALAGGGGSGGEGGDNGASAALFAQTTRKIDEAHDVFSKRMKQIDINVQNGLTDI